MMGTAMRTLLLASVVGSLAGADEPWHFVAERNGVTLEKRAVVESRYLEYRARARTSVSAPLATARIWDGIGDERSPALKHRTVLRRSDEELVVYDQIRAPVVSDRDVTIRIRKVADARSGAFEIAFESIGDGPGPAAGYVRLPVVRGEWRIEPDGAGGANLAYRCYSEPGGSIPAFLVRGAQQSQVLDEFERALARVGR
jgi:hypothetical protein